ncbi:MAG: VOC family protein [Acidimicrobiales bacterium]
MTFDCADPHAQARFWAAALDYTLDDHHEMIGGLIEAGHLSADGDDVVVVDGRRRFREYASIADPNGEDRLLFQLVDEPKTAKNRVHLDIHPGADQRDAKVQQLVDLGATRLWDGQLGPQSWVTLADPEGNELCVSG